MNRRKFLPVVVMGLLSPGVIKRLGRRQSNDWTALPEQAWNIVNDKYYDNSFRGLNWRQVYEKQRSNKYTSATAAYAAIYKSNIGGFTRIFKEQWGIKARYSVTNSYILPETTLCTNFS